MLQAEWFSTPWVLSSYLLTETCTFTYFWLCSTFKTGVYFHRVKPRNGELSNRWNCGLFWCHKFHKRVILDNRTQLKFTSRYSQTVNQFIGFQCYTLVAAKMLCVFFFNQHPHAFESILVFITSASIIFNSPVEESLKLSTSVQSQYYVQCTAG